jgi:hypothetical protein
MTMMTQATTTMQRQLRRLQGRRKPDNGKEMAATTKKAPASATKKAGAKKKGEDIIDTSLASTPPRGRSSMPPTGPQATS